ncbi:MAG: GNAT family N-acetyltransferase [Pyrinomonadaceae bacterium]|nr:GNAT family N-acetyltransferase [Pyrinomonadaceae bacterium]MBP6212556.1 GNAT family N-acetyltransferase [Pyrinomonadaceae bacterium]
MERSVSLRIAGTEDTAFLRRVYFSSRHDEVAMFGWNEAQATAFLEMQFSLQVRAYAMQFPTAESLVILCDGERAGRMVIDRRAREISLVDIAVLPQFRQNGIATELIRGLQAEAAENDQTVELHVAKINPKAFALYQRLGFCVTGETPLHFEMSWDADRQ